MASINTILESKNCEYKWTINDCLITTTDLLKEQNKRFPDYTDFHKQTEKEAILHSKQKYGSMLKAHEKLFSNCGLEIIKHEESNLILSITPGDIILFSYKESPYIHLGFVNEACEIITHELKGMNLIPENSEIRGIVR